MDTYIVHMTWLYIVQRKLTASLFQPVLAAQRAYVLGSYPGHLERDRVTPRSTLVNEDYQGRLLLTISYSIQSGLRE